MLRQHVDDLDDLDDLDDCCPALKVRNKSIIVLVKGYGDSMHHLSMIRVMEQAHSAVRVMSESLVRLVGYR